MWKRIILVLFFCVFLGVLFCMQDVKAETDPERFVCLETLTEHSEAVLSVAFSPNNELLASGSLDDTIKIWNTSDWSEIKTLTGHSDYVFSVAFSQNNKWLASGSYDNTIKIWNVSDWSCIKTLTGHSGWVYGVAFTQNNERLASGSKDKTIKIWNTSDWSCIKTLNEHSGWVFSVAFSQNNKWLASGSLDDKIKIWNVSDWNCIKTLTGHSSNIYSVSFSINNEWLASGSEDKTIRIWNTSDWSCLQTLTEHSDDVKSLAFSPNNEWLASGSYDDTIKIWNTSDWSEIKTLTGHSDSVYSMTISSNNEWLATGALDKTIKIWCNAPDLTQTTSDISFSEPDIIAGYPITIYAKINNIGLINVTNVTINFYDDEKLIGNDTIDVLANNTEIASVIWNVPSTLGDRKIYVKIDEDDNIVEENETNNEASINVNIRGADLTLTSSDISFSGPYIIAGYPITIYAKIHNIGLINVTNVTINFYDDEKLISNDTIDVLANKTEKAFIDWEVPSILGNRKIYVKIDEENNIVEENEMNNTACMEIIVIPKFLPIISSENLTKTANPEQIINYNINILNYGGKQDKIYLSFSSKESWFCYLNRTEVSPEPSKSGNVTLTIISPFGSKVGDFSEIKITALSNGNTSRNDTVIFNTTINQIHKVDLSLDKDYANLNPGESINYTIKIMNIGNGEDTINLKLSGKNSNWGEIDESEINLTQNGCGEVKLNVKVPEDAKALEVAKIVIEAYSGNTFLDFIETTTIVNQIYEVALKIDKNQLEATPNESVEYKITITNKGNGKDTVRLELFGINSNWGYFDNSILILDADESKTVNLIVNVPKSAINGEKATITIQAISKSGITSNSASTITSVKNPENKEPKVDFKITYNDKIVTKVRIGELITFDASTSSDEDGKIEIYQWNFGNGVVRYGEKVKYSYPEDTKSGTYIITLNVTDSSGATTEKHITIEVLEEEKKESSLLYLILIVLIIIGVIIVIMLFKVVENLKNLGEVSTKPLPIGEKEAKVSASSLEEETKNEVQEIKEIEMWKPKPSEEKENEETSTETKINIEPVMETKEKVNNFGLVPDEETKMEGNINKELEDSNDVWKKWNKDFKNTNEKKEVKK